MHLSRVSSLDLIQNMGHAMVYVLISPVFECMTHCASHHALYLSGKTLHAYVLYIPVRRHASHHIFISYTKHDDDRLMILSCVSNIIWIIAIKQHTILVVPHKAVAEVSKVGNL